MKDIFQNDTPRLAWFQRIIAAALMIGAFLCIYQPEIHAVKEWAKYAPQITIAYWLLGLVFLILKIPRLTMVTFASCALLCIYLKNSSNQELVQPTATNQPSIQIAQFNLSASSDNYMALLETIFTTNAEVVSLQEVPFDRQKWLQDTLKNIYPHHCNASAIDFYGIQIFSKLPFLTCDTFYSNNIPNLTVSVFPKYSKSSLYIVSSYVAPPLFSSAYKTMQTQFQSISEKIKTFKQPYITVGDYNIESSSSEIQKFRSETDLLDSRRGFQPIHKDGSINLTEVPTDHIFFSKNFQCVDFQTISGQKGIHYGIVGTYQFIQDSTNVKKTN